MPSIDVKLQTHLRSYQRLLAAESERLRSQVHFGDAAQRKAVLNRLKSLRLATRDLERVIAKAELASAPRTSATALPSRPSPSLPAPP